MPRVEKDGSDASGPNPYVRHLGLVRVPEVEEAATRQGVKLFHLMVLAILERGGSMSLEEIAQRLAGAGIAGRSGDLNLSLKRAWHGCKPVYRDPAGRFDLDLDCLEMDHLLWALNCHPREPQLMDPPLPQEVVVSVPGPEVPLSEEELQAALRDRSMWAISLRRQTAALLDVRGGPLPVAEVDQALEVLSSFRPRLTIEVCRRWQGDLVTVDEAGRLHLNRSSADIPAMRQAIRRAAHPVLLAQAREASAAELLTAWERREEEKRQRDRETAARLRRGVVRAVLQDGVVRVAAVLDLDADRVQVFWREEVDRLRETLEAYDLLAGLSIRDLLFALGQDVLNWRVTALEPPQKGWQLRGGRKVSLTPRLVLRSTLWRDHPLEEPAVILQALRQGRHRWVVRRLERDLRNLAALYRYGLTHGYVLARWGDDQSALAVDWAQPGDLTMRGTVREAMERRCLLGASLIVPETGELVDVEGMVEGMDRWTVQMTTPFLGLLELDYEDVFSVRLLEPSET
jgi:hypothetical protein